MVHQFSRLKLCLSSLFRLLISSSFHYYLLHSHRNPSTVRVVIWKRMFEWSVPVSHYSAERFKLAFYEASMHNEFLINFRPFPQNLQKSAFSASASLSAGSSSSSSSSSGHSASGSSSSSSSSHDSHSYHNHEYEEPQHHVSRILAVTLTLQSSAGHVIHKTLCLNSWELHNFIIYDEPTLCSALRQQTKCEAMKCLIIYSNPNYCKLPTEPWVYKWFA
jgi:hypothetical protein